jgi:hypothetical protein
MVSEAQRLCLNNPHVKQGAPFLMGRVASSGETPIEAARRPAALLFFDAGSLGGVRAGDQSLK